MALNTLSAVADSFIPERLTLLGCQLKPLSLSHFLFMQKLNCGFAGEDVSNDVGLDDLAIAMVVCSFNYEEFSNLIENKDPFTGKLQKDSYFISWKYPFLHRENYFQKTMRINGKNLSKFIKKYKVGVLDIKNCMKSFGDYIQAQTASPTYVETEIASKNDSLPSGTHWSQVLFSTAVSSMGYSRSQALNTPLKQLFSDFYRFAEANGSLRMLSMEEETEIKEMMEAAQQQNQTLI